MQALLDVNVLIALLDAAHVHHAAARAWLTANIRYGWASCPITQNGCIRILSQPAYPGRVAPARAAELLRGAVKTHHHEFWADEVSLLDDDLIDWSAVLVPHQLTDGYLLALAVAHKARLVTFDRHVPLAAVRGANARHLVLI